MRMAPRECMGERLDDSRREDHGKLAAMVPGKKTLENVCGDDMKN